MNFKLLFSIYITFFKIGCFTLGGGYAMIPIIESEVVDKKNWVKKEDMIDFIALAQSVPGVIGINTASLVGIKLYGITGGIIATIGMIMPSLIIIIIIASFFNEFQKWDIIQNAFKGVRAAVVALIFISVINIGKNGIKEKKQLIIMIIAALAIIVFKISPIYMIILGACSGLLYCIKIAEK